MSRGGRGGRGGGNNNLPFEVDEALDAQLAANRAASREDGDDWMINVLFPPMNIRAPPPPTDREKKLVAMARERRIRNMSGPLYMHEPKAGKRNAAEFDAFEDQPTFNNKRAKDSAGLPSLKNVGILKEYLPAELHAVVSDGEDDESRGKKTTNLEYLKKKRIDKLARFDDGADADATAGDADDDEPANDDVDDEDRVEMPSDNDFSEADDDVGDDYNAEKYFDNGSDRDDEGDGGDAGDDEAW